MKDRKLYFFQPGKAEGNEKMKETLGGKGAGLAGMALGGLPVPPGFTISTVVCRDFYKKGRKVPADVDRLMVKYLRRLERVTGKKFGDPGNPLLVSIRSGAPVSMPGMMDTILNVGLNDSTVEGFARLTNNPRFAYDCYRRLVSMFGNVVKGIPKTEFDEIFDEVKKKYGVEHDQEVPLEGLKELVEKYKNHYKNRTGTDFPQDPLVQIRLGRDAVFQSWMNERAVEYRRIYKIPESMGTACNIQMMAFGNMGDDSGTGVGFTRNPANGANEVYGEFLVNAQGEDVVAGERTPQKISELRNRLPAVYDQLVKTTKRLEKHYRDIQDFEFTVERGKLFMLQTRSGKRTGIAALRIAVDLVKERIINPREAVMLVSADHINQLLHPVFDPNAKKTATKIASGLNASPGAASGYVTFDPEQAVELRKQGKKTILVRPETSADDIHGMAAAQGILTQVGGQTSHAAVVARHMGKPAVVGCSGIKVNLKKKCFEANGSVVKEGDSISIDGATGEVFLGELPVTDSEIIQVLKGTVPENGSSLFPYWKTFFGWLTKFKKLTVRANSDLPDDAALARKLGAEGIGLCRTEHMFFAEDRLPIMREMIMAESVEQRKGALAKLLELQREDFIGLFKAMDGYSVTIRTLDPPLHEFLPSYTDLAIQYEIARRENNQQKVREIEPLLNRVRQLAEMNPMMGHRGCRLGVTMPEITEMQARAILEAAVEMTRQGKKIVPEIMIPVVSTVKELQHQRRIVEEVAEKVFSEKGRRIQYMVGTMIETPRAALTADELAEVADFFSFGTNDLTQMTFGFSRDDVPKFIGSYLEQKILSDDPFVTIDQNGVGKLVKMAVESGKRVNKKLKVGICGEHGGEERSVKFCHRAGLDYVSCSAYRVPIAYLAAAQAAIEDSMK